MTSKSNTPLHYTRHGQGTPLVLLHGWGNDLSIWSHCVSKWKNQFEIFCIDLPGHGNSPNIEGGLVAWLEALSTILNQLSNKPIVMGWSLGGLLANCLVNHMPSGFFKAYIGVCSSVCFVEKKDWPYGLKKHVWSDFSKHLETDHQKTLHDFLYLQCLGSKRDEKLNHYIHKMKNAIKTPDAKMLKTGADILAQVDCRTIKTNHTPMYYLLGQKDRLVSPKLADYFKQQSIEYTLEGRWGHIPFLTDFEGFNFRFTQFIKKIL